MVVGERRGGEEEEAAVFGRREEAAKIVEAKRLRQRCWPGERRRRR